MATIAVVSSKISARVQKHVWETLVTGSLDGQPVYAPGASGLTVQVVGTFDTATIVLQGSNDGGTTWFTLKDVGANALSYTAAGGGFTPECPEQVRPLVSSVGGSTDLDCHLVVRM